MPTTGYSTHFGSRGKKGRQDHSVKSIARLRQISNHNRNNKRQDTETIIGTGNVYKDTQAVYDRYLPHAKEEYNAQQIKIGKRERIITGSFFSHMSDNDKSNMAVEAIIGAGDKDFWVENDWFQYLTDDEAREALLLLLDLMQKNFPDLKIASAIIHNRDQTEASWHMHVVGVPIIPVDQLPRHKVKAIARDDKGKPLRDKKGNTIQLYDIDKNGKRRKRYEKNPDGTYKLTTPNTSGLSMTVCQSAVITRKRLKQYHNEARVAMTAFYKAHGIDMRAKGEHARGYVDVPEYPDYVAKMRQAEETLADAENRAGDIIRGAQGAKAQLVGEGEDIKAKKINEGETEKAVMILQATGEAEKILLDAEAQAEAEAEKIRAKAQAEVEAGIAPLLAEKQQLDNILPKMRREHEELAEALRDAPQQMRNYKKIKAAVKSKIQQLKNEGATNDELLSAGQAVYDEAQPDMRDLVGGVIVRLYAELEDQRALQAFCKNNDIDVDIDYTR